MKLLEELQNEEVEEDDEEAVSSPSSPSMTGSRCSSLYLFSSFVLFILFAASFRGNIPSSKILLKIEALRASWSSHERSRKEEAEESSSGKNLCQKLEAFLWGMLEMDDEGLLSVGAIIVGDALLLLLVVMTSLLREFEVARLKE